MIQQIKKIILFSIPTETNQEKIYQEMFPKELKQKVFAYMPSDGSNNPEKFTKLWENISKQHNAEFLYINNCARDIKKEINKLNTANILLITGGNTFSLLKRLKETGMDKAIINFTKKDNFVLAGFSAGALVITPNISVCNLEKFDNNEVGLEDLDALNLVNFEIFPHYKKEDSDVVEKYSEQTKNNVRTIGDEEYIILNL